MKTVRTLVAVLVGLAACGISLARTDDKSAKPESAKPRATRVAVLHVGSDDENGAKGKDSGALGLDVPSEPYVNAARELEAAGADVVVLRINSWGGRVERFVDAVEQAFRPRLRTVGWVSMAASGSAVFTAALPEVCMTSDANWGASTHTGTGYDMAAWQALGERAAKVGGRAPEFVRAMQFIQPLSMSMRDGKRVFMADESGELVLSKADGSLCLNAKTALACGASIGIADTRDDLARVLGIERVEWVGADIDAKVRDSCREAAADVKQLGHLYITAELAYGASEKADSEARRTLERGKRDAAWVEIKKLRAKWPGLAEAWPVMLTSSGYGMSKPVQWADIAKTIGVKEDGGK